MRSPLHCVAIWVCRGRPACLPCLRRCLPVCATIFTRFCRDVCPFSPRYSPVFATIFARFCRDFRKICGVLLQGVGCGMGVAGNAPTVAAVAVICGGANDVANWAKRHCTGANFVANRANIPAKQGKHAGLPLQPLPTRQIFSIFTPNATPEPKNAPLARASATGSTARYVWRVKKRPPTHVLRF